MRDNQGFSILEEAVPEPDHELVSVAEIRAAASRIDGVVTRTPLMSAPRLKPGLLLKPESLQPTGSFKLRGAYAAITASLDAARNSGVVTHSSGNHGHAIAYAAAQLGIKAVVVVPRNTPAVKTEPISRYGAELVRVEPTHAARVAATRELVDKHGYELIPPFEDRRVIAGQGTIGLEIAAACQAGLVLVPVSGGGLVSGIAAAIRAVSPGTAVFGVEPELAADARDSLRNGRRVAWPAADTQRTAADALRVEQVGELPFVHMREFVAGIVTVTEDEIFTAMARLARDTGLVAEPGGAVAVAAALFRTAELPAASPTVAVVSGGNVDPALLARILQHPRP